jgi:hypothetical protein
MPLLPRAEGLRCFLQLLAGACRSELLANLGKVTVQFARQSLGEEEAMQ